MVIMTIFKNRKYYKDDRKAKVIEENIAYSARMFPDVLEASKLTAEFETVLSFIRPTSDVFLVGPPSILGISFAESLTEENRQRCDKLLDKRDTVFRWKLSTESDILEKHLDKVKKWEIKYKPWIDWAWYIDQTDEWLNLNDKYEPLVGINCEERTILVDIVYVGPQVGFEKKKKVL